MSSDPDAVFKDVEITPEEKAELMDNIRHRLTPQPIKMRADVDVSCFTYEGIDAVKAALKSGLISDGDESVKVTDTCPYPYEYGHRAPIAVELIPTREYRLLLSVNERPH